MEDVFNDQFLDELKRVHPYSFIPVTPHGQKEVKD